MAINNYGVVILSKVKSVYNGHIFDVQSTEALQNGFVGHLGDLVSGEREIRTLVKPTTATIATDGIVLVAHDEIVYDKTTKMQSALQNYITPVNTPARAYEIVRRDTIEVSKNLIIALGDNVVEGNYVTATNGQFILTETDTKPTSAFYGKIVGTRKLGISTVVGQPDVISGAIDLVEIEILKNEY